MATMDFQGKSIEVDDDGYLLNLDDWTKEMADHLASLDGLPLLLRTGRLSTSCVTTTSSTRLLR